jgi:hypothetical protein
LQGESFPDYKLVEGRSNRVFTDKAESVLVEKLGEKAYNKKLIGIGDAEKELGREIDKITFKPKGKPTLAHSSDKRKAIVVKDILLEFDDLENETGEE